MVVAGQVGLLARCSSISVSGIWTGSASSSALPLQPLLEMAGVVVHRQVAGVAVEVEAICIQRHQRHRDQTDQWQGLPLPAFQVHQMRIGRQRP